MMSPTARTLAELRKRGFVAEVVERRVPRTHTTIDFLGCLDIICCHPARGIVGIQVTSGSNMAARLKKCRREPRLAVWLASAGQCEVWGWRKVTRGRPRPVWEPRIVAVTRAELEGVA